jgi:hypothetical protein
MPKFCPTCGKQLQFENAEICPSCGVRIQPQPIQTEIRNPWIAVILSFLCLGWGQWYNGRTWDGLKFFGAFLGTYILMIIVTALAVSPGLSILILFAFILFIVLLGIWIYGMYDAYTTAEKINRTELEFSGKSGLFWLPFAFIILAVLLIFAAVIAAFTFGMAGNIQKTKVVAATVTQQGNNIIITYQGGSDAYQVSKLKYGVGSLNKEWNSPKVGDKVTLSGGTSGRDNVIVSAVFTDGTEQVILDTFV